MPFSFSNINIVKGISPTSLQKMSTLYSIVGTTSGPINIQNIQTVIQTNPNARFVSGFCKSIPGIQKGSIGLQGLYMDGGNNLYYGGSYVGTNPFVVPNLDGSDSSIILPVSSNTDSLLAKYNSTGQCQMASSIISSPGGAMVRRILVDASSNIWITGFYAAPAQVTINNLNNGTPSSVTLPSTSNNNQTYMARFTSNGICTLGACITAGANFATANLTPSIALDSSNNCYFATGYRSTVPFTIPNLDGSPSTMIVPAASSSNNSIGLLVKYNSNGIISAAQAFTSTTTGSFDQMIIAIDTSHNVYIGGGYITTSTYVLKNLDGTNSTITMPTTSGGADACLIKFNSSGTCVAGTKIISGNVNDYVYGLTFDSSNNMYVTGTYTSSGSVTVRNLDGTNSSIVLPSTSNYYDMYLMKYNTSGVCTAGANILSGTRSDYVQCIVSDSNDNLYLCGIYTTASNVTVKNINGSNSAYTLPANNTLSSPCLLKFNSSGVCQAAINTMVITSGPNSAVALTLNSTGSTVYMTGYYSSTAPTTPRNLDGTDSAFKLPFSAGLMAFLLGYNTSTGALISCPTLHHYANTFMNGVPRCLVDSSNSLWVWCNFALSGISSIPVANFDGSSSSVSLQSTSDYDPFLIKYNDSGNCVLGTCILQGTGSDSIVTIALDGSNNIYVGGAYTSTVTVQVRNLDGTTSAFTLPATSSSDAFLIKYNSSGTCLAAVNIIPDSGSSMINGGSGGLTFDSSGQNLYITGLYTSPTGSVTVKNLDGTNSSISLPTSLLSDAMLLKYNSSGVCTAGISFPGTSHDQTLQVVFDASGNFYVSLLLQSTTTTTIKNLDGTNSSIVLPITSSIDLCILKYNSSGTCIAGANIIAGTGADVSLHLSYSVSTQGLIIGGYASTSSSVIRNLNGSTSSFALTSAATTVSNAYILRMSSAGTVTVASVIVTGTGFCDVESIVEDLNQNLWVTGKYTSTSAASILNLDGSSSGFTLPISTNTNMYIIKYNSSGIVQVATDLGTAAGSTSGGSLAMNQYGDIYLPLMTSCTSNMTLKQLDNTTSINTIPFTLGRGGLYILKF